MKHPFQVFSAANDSFTELLGINDAGTTVGFYDDASGMTHGFVHSGGLYTTVDVPGASATTINGINRINDAGKVVGFDVNAAGTRIALKMS